jgi:hypothetical protein
MGKRMRRFGRLFDKDEKRPGQPILAAGIASSVLVSLLGLLWLTVDPFYRAETMLKIAIEGPIFLGLLLTAIVPAIYSWAYLGGAPDVSVTYTLSMLKLFWRGIAGGCLIICAVFAAVYGIINFLDTPW